MLITYKIISKIASKTDNTKVKLKDTYKTENMCPYCTFKVWTNINQWTKSHKSDHCFHSTMLQI